MTRAKTQETRTKTQDVAAAETKQSRVSSGQWLDSTAHRERLTPSSVSVRIAQWCGATIIALVPFHAFLTVWGASFGLNYTVLRLWSALLLGVLIGCSVVWLARDASLRTWVRHSFLARISLIYAALSVLMGLRGLLLGNVSGVALLTGLLQNLRYVAFFLVVVAFIKYSQNTGGRWLRILLIGAVIVSGFAVLQYTALPHDFLGRFGYNVSTIEPFETINNNPDYLRVASTLRGANPLGAYLVVVIAVLAAFWPRLQHKAMWGIMLVLVCAALLFSFSRSAWIGTVVALVCVFILRLRTRQQWRRAGLVAFSLGVVLVAAFIAFEQNRAVQNALYHTDDNSTVAVSSNDQRSTAIITGVRQVVQEPFGRGVGSAGPASVHNDVAPIRLAENYYLQIGQEVGWAGLFAYVVLTVLVGTELWRRRQDPLALGLLAAFVGLFFVNMLSHAWADDTLAFIWWGLAGVVIGQGLWQKNTKRS